MGEILSLMRSDCFDPEAISILSEALEMRGSN